MQKVKVVINQTVRRYNVSHKGIKFSSSTNVVGVGKSAYDIYKETTTDNPILNESDWIDSLYGQDGVTPTIGANGNWFIGDTDTGTVATTGNVVPEKPYFNVPMKCPIPYVGTESEIEEGWSLCNGRYVAGYGVVPDMRGRFIVGADPRTPSMPTDTSTNLKNYGAVGNTGGKDFTQLRTEELPLHSFKTVVAGTNVGNTPRIDSDPNLSIIGRSVDQSDGNNDYQLIGKNSTPTLGKTNTVGGDQPHENRPPYYVVAFIIRTSYVNANGGRSAYEIALLNGFIGTEAEWLTSLNGKSAYQIALDYGFTGSIEQWILSLKGISGNDGRGIVSIARTSGNGAAGTTDTYTISYSNSTTSTYQVVNGANGSPGTNGRGITSNVRISGNGSAGTTDTYRITYTDGSYTDYTVVNGTNGSATEILGYALSDQESNISVGIKIKDTIPYNCTLISILLSLSEAPTGSVFQANVKKNGTSIFTTKITIDVNELDNLTAATPYALVTTPTLFSVGDRLEISIDAVGGVNTGKGAIIKFNLIKT